MTRDALAIVVYGVPTVGLLGQGVLYLTTPEFMPYHADALGASWHELPANYRGFILGVIRAMGAGSVSVTVALGIMLIVPFRRGERWTRWAVPLVGAMFTLLTAYGAFTIERLTPASPPWRATLGLTACYLAGAALTFRSRSRDAITASPSTG